jgi:hypothetical protein
MTRIKFIAIYHVPEALEKEIANLKRTGSCFLLDGRKNTAQA